MSRHRSHRASTGTAGLPRGLLLLGLAFGLVLTFVGGMRFAAARGDGAGKAALQESKLSRLDRQEQELRQRRAQERARLSFHSTLAGPARSPVLAKAAAPAALAKAAKQAPKAGDSQAEAVQAEKKQDSETQAAQEQVAEKLQTVTEPAKPENLSQQALALLNQAQPGPQATAQSDERLPAVAAAEKDPDVQLKGADDDEPEQKDIEDDPAHYSLQVGAFPDASSAQSLVERLSQKGYAVRIVSAEVAGKGTWYRVRVGDFKARDKAEQKCSQLSDNEGLFALVVPERG